MIDGQPRSTGDAYYSPMFLKAFGQNVVLPKGDVIKGIFQRYPLTDNVGTDTANLIRYSYRLWIPKLTALEYDIDRGQTIVLIDQASGWVIRNYYDDGDGWYCYTLTYREDLVNPKLTPVLIEMSLSQIRVS